MAATGHSTADYQDGPLPPFGLTIGDLARRTGLSVSAIRFYEQKGLIHPVRSAGNQRRYLRADIRRLSFVMIAQKLGFSIGEIASELSGLPKDRAPSLEEWQESSTRFMAEIERRIASLERLRGRLEGCIGCGCLSLEKCALYNPGDEASDLGTGPSVLADTPPPDLTPRL